MPFQFTVAVFYAKTAEELLSLGIIDALPRPSRWNLENGETLILEPITASLVIELGAELAAGSAVTTSGFILRRGCSVGPWPKLKSFESDRTKTVHISWW